MGRSIYAKIISATYSSTSGQGVNIAHGISTADYGYYTILNLIGMPSDNMPYFYPLNYNTGTSYNFARADRTYVYLQTTQANLLGRSQSIAIIFAA